jgi:hypothetical protein
MTPRLLPRISALLLCRMSALLLCRMSALLLCRRTSRLLRLIAGLVFGRRIVLAVCSALIAGLVCLTTGLPVLLILLLHGPHRRIRLLIRRRPELPRLLLTLLRLSTRSRLPLLVWRRFGLSVRRGMRLFVRRRLGPLVAGGFRLGVERWRCFGWNCRLGRGLMSRGPRW